MKRTLLLCWCASMTLAACDDARRASVATTAAPLEARVRSTSEPGLRTSARDAQRPMSPKLARPGKPPPALARWDGVTTTLHRDAATGLGFAIPAAGFRLESEHFDASLPVHQTKAIFTLFGPAGPAVSIDVWDVPAGTTLLSFFEAHLSFMIVSTTKVAAKSESFVQLDEPRSPQSYARRASVFAAPGRVLRVTCHDTTDHGAVAAFEQVMKTLPRGAAP